MGSKDGRGATYAFEGAKRLLASARPYAVVVTRDPSHPSAPAGTRGPAGARTSRHARGRSRRVREEHAPGAATSARAGAGAGGTRPQSGGLPHPHVP